MRSEPGFMRSLREELTQILPEFQDRVHRVGALLDDELIKMTTRQDADPAMYFPDQPDEKSVYTVDSVSSLDELEGERMIRDGEVAFVILAGGAGTRMGGPKVFAKIPGVETSLLAWKLMQGSDMPTWVMTSPDMLHSMAHHIDALALSPKTRGTIFTQFEGYRLTPDNRLVQLAPGVPDMYPLGHGDVGPALVESGILDENRGVKYACIVNVDNVLGSPHSGLLGFHKRQGMDVTCEVVERKPNDKGGVLAVVNNRLQVAEDWRLPAGFTDGSRWHNTNSFIINVDVFKASIDWRWHRIRKQVGNRLVIQHERLLQQYTEEFSTQFVCTPREARYQSIKTADDLDVAGKLLAGYRYA